MTIKYADMGPCSEVCLKEGTLKTAGQAYIGLRPIEGEAWKLYNMLVFKFRNLER